MVWLEKARNGSKSFKNRLAIILAVSITLLIVGLWVLVLKNKNTTDEVKASSTSESLKPLFMIFQNAKLDFKNVKENFAELKSKGVDTNATTTDNNIVE